MKILPSFAAMLLSVAGAVCAQESGFPNKPIKMIVGYGPGGGTDIVARIVATGLTEEMGQSVYIENKPGASGTIGASTLVRSPADGYTLMMGVVSLNAVQPFLNPNLPYDTARDMMPVTLVASVPHFIAVHPSLPVNTLKEFIAYAKAHPKELSFGSAGNGTTPHLAGEIFKNATQLLSFA